MAAPDRSRNLTRDELPHLPELRERPPGARILHEYAAGTYDGVGFDGFIPNAALTRFLTSEQTVEQVIEWYEGMLTGLGWPPAGRSPRPAPTRHEWTRGFETLSVDDEAARMERPDMFVHRFVGQVPRGWSLWTLRYERAPADGWAGAPPEKRPTIWSDG